MPITDVGFGCKQFELAVYIKNRPPLIEYQALENQISLTNGEIHAIGQQCGNGWRKVFNVFAKFLFRLPIEKFNYQQQANTWQNYRDQLLLQTGSKTALLFSTPCLNDNGNIHIIAGRTYGKELLDHSLDLVDLVWINEEFAISKSERVIICPYFDYRQLSNIKIDHLCKLVDELKIT